MKIATAGESTQDFAHSIGSCNGINGYVYQTVPVVIQTWLRYQADYQTGILVIIRCGGDTDTTAAIFADLLTTVKSNRNIMAIYEI